MGAPGRHLHCDARRRRPVCCTLILLFYASLQGVLERIFGKMNFSFRSRLRIAWSWKKARHIAELRADSAECNFFSHYQTCCEALVNFHEICAKISDCNENSGTLNVGKRLEKSPNFRKQIAENLWKLHRITMIISCVHLSHVSNMCLHVLFCVDTWSTLKKISYTILG